MDNWYFSENSIRAGIFLIGFLSFSALGLIFPFRKVEKSRRCIIFHNISLFFINVLMQKALPSFTLILLAQYLEKNSLGLFNIFYINFYLEVLIVLILMDLVIYIQHVLSHRIPILWKLHRVHHTDIGFDTSTALRFHPIEIVLSLITKATFVILLGISPLEIFIFEILINFSAMFHHSNISLPTPIENVINKMIVTPDLHRIHHSIEIRETDSNFSFFISAWDRVFKTYISKSKADPKSMPIGIETHRELKEQKFLRLLLQPFNNK